MDRRSLLQRAAAFLTLAPTLQLDEQARAALINIEGELAAIASQEAKDVIGQRGWYDEDGVRQGGLMAFVRRFWRVLEPAAELVEGWPLWAICEHLEAVTFGDIQRLLINVPPGFMKSLLTSVFWPAWEWGPMGKPHYRYICFAYSQSLTHRDNKKFRSLVSCPDYQAMYGDTVKLANETTEDIYSTATGRKLASSAGGVGTGERGDRIILDDPHNVIDAESDTVRSKTVQWFRESLYDRMNNENTAMVIIMQRVHEDDVSGLITSKNFPFVHLCVPMEFDTNRETYTNTLGWTDPRHDPDDPNANAGMLAFPERFSAETVQIFKEGKGPYAYASQYQQLPAPRSGGIFDRNWWQLWEHPKNKFPACEFVLVSVDGAFTEKEENNLTGCTVWGRFEWCKSCGLAINDYPTTTVFDEHVCGCTSRVALKRLILLDAWQKWIPFSGVNLPKGDRESLLLYQMRTQKHWGLMEWITFTANKYGADQVLIEAKGPGISAAQALRAHYSHNKWGVTECPVKGDKVARALAAQPIFSQGLVFAPNKDYADMVIQEMANFPKARHNDLTDSATQAINWFRSNWDIQTDQEVANDRHRAMMYKPRRKPIYPV